MEYILLRCRACCGVSPSFLSVFKSTWILSSYSFLSAISRAEPSVEARLGASL
jgi:hypothetical protein